MKTTPTDFSKLSKGGQFTPLTYTELQSIFSARFPQIEKYVDAVSRYHWLANSDSDLETSDSQIRKAAYFSQAERFSNTKITYSTFFHEVDRIEKHLLNDLKRPDVVEATSHIWIFYFDNKTFPFEMSFWTGEFFKAMILEIFLNRKPNYLHIHKIWHWYKSGHWPCGIDRTKRLVIY